MDLKYINEHYHCINNSSVANTLIEYKKLPRHSSYEFNPVQGTIVFLLGGSLKFSFQAFCDLPMANGQMLYLPPDYPFSYFPDEDSEMLIVRLPSKIQLCENYLLDRLVQETSSVFRQKQPGLQRRPPFLLKMNKFLVEYALSLVSCLEHGIRCKAYFEIKINELFYLLRSFYLKEDLLLFLEKALNSDTGFSYFIQQNYYKFQTLSEMAMAMNMTLSGFEKRFKKVFKTSGYRWMNEHKARKIHHAICTEDTPLKEISMRFGFSSQSAFNDFCKKKLGFPPGQIRKSINGQK